MEEITGVIKSIRFTSDKTGYTVCDVRSEKAITTLVGIMPMLAIGENIVARGEYVYHADYGRQFKVESCERKTPTREEEIEEYLSSGIIKGLGPATARKIVELFKDQTFQIIQFEPYRLTEISGITPDKALFYGQAFLEHENMRNIVMLMQRYGVSSGAASKVWKKYGTRAESEIRNNPYCLSEPPVSLSFTVCDRIALATGFEPYSKERLKSAVLHVISAFVSNGHTFCPREELLKGTVKIARVEKEFVEDAFDALVLEGRLVVEKQHPDRIYPENLIQAERYCTRRLTSLNFMDLEGFNALDTLLDDYESLHGIHLDDIQRQAIQCAASHGLCVITGGPGTGKTTIIKGLIHVFESRGQSVILAAPTGRAAKRISETAGCEAKTLHRLLEVGYSIDDEERPYFMRNEDNPLSADVIIIDEASMLDLPMLSALLQALPDKARLILVGDADQLPSVGPGRVLADMIQSEAFPVVKLETIFRQSGESLIISNAHLINQGQMLSLIH
ncbi:MAG: AAA family ATPase, partial [Clostridia bacterium]|nr:AAA family ATPase [Clostridia bacterium]